MSIFVAARTRTLPARVLTLVALAAVLISSITIVGVAAPAAASALVSLNKSAPERTLVGGDIEYSLAATSTHSDLLFNLSFRDVLPAGVTYKGGSTAPASMGEPIQVAELDGSNNPTGRTILIWRNVADLAASETVTLTFAAETDDEVLPTGAQAVNEGNAYVSTFERRVPRFNSRGVWAPHSQIQESLEASATTVITPITIEKSEPNPENELMRGVQDNWTTYTLTLRNNHANPTTDLTVVDYLPAGLEFLGCRTADNSSAAEYPGAGSLAGGGVSDCYEGSSRVELASVTTVAAPHSGLPAGTPAGAVFTRVEWTIPAGLAVSEEFEINYAAGIPLRENTLDWDGGTPDTDGAQASNLDNNNGAPTREGATEDSLTNYASVSGTYQGPDVDGPGPIEGVGDETSHTVSIEDVRIVKSVADTKFVQDGFADYTLDIRVSQYVTAAAFTVTDELPNGLCPTGAPAGVYVDQNGDPLDPVTSPLIDDECLPSAVGGESVSGATITEVMARENGTFRVTFELNPDAQAANADHQITYRAKMRSSYTMDGQDPTAAGDSFTNNVALTATTTPIDANNVDEGTQVVNDTSDATITAGLPGLIKRIKPNTAANYDCTGADGVFTNDVTNSPEFHFTVGSRVCFELEIPFSNSAHTKNPVLVDFLPENLVYEAGSLAAHADNDVAFNFVEGTFSEEGNVGVFEIGTVQGSDRFVDLGDTFKVRFSAIVTESSMSEVDVHGNLAKLRWEDTEGRVQSLRDQVDFFVPPPPPIEITKYAADEDDLLTPVVHGDEVTYRVELTHGGDPSLANDVDISDIEAWDVLPAAFECTDVTDLNGAACTDPGDASHPTFDGNDVHSALTWTLAGPLEYGGPALVFEYTVTIPENTSVGTTYTNTAHVRTYNTDTNRLEDGDPVRTPQYPMDNIDTDVPEEDWTVPAANDPAAVELPDVGVEKSLSTSQNETGNTDSQAVPGETVTYTIDAVVPPLTTVYNGVLSDTTIPAELLVSNVLTSYSLDGSDTFTPGTETDFTLAPEGVQLTFPSRYQNDSETDAHVFRLVVTAVVDPDLESGHNANRTNTATFTSTSEIATGSPAVPPVSDTATVNLRQPAPQIVKTNDADGPLVIDEVVEFTLQLGQANNRPPLHDWVVVDCVPAGLTDVTLGTPGAGTASIVTDPTDVDCAVDETAIQWVAPADGEPGASIGQNTLSDPLFQLTYTAQINPGAGGGQGYQNTAALTGSTIDDGGNTPTTERVITVEDTSTVTIQDATLTKDVDESTATIGDERTWTLTATIPGNVNLYNAAIVDQLPAGVTVDHTDITFSCVDADDVTCVLPTDATPVTRDGQTIGWSLGTITTHPVERTVTITYTGLVDDVAANQAGQTRANTAQLRWNQPPGGANPGDVTEIEDLDAGSNTPTSTVTIVEPNVTITKSVSNDEPGPGDSFTYTVTVANSTGATVSDAFNIVATDVVPTGVVLAEGPLVVTPASAGATATLNGADPILGGGTITISTDGPLAPGDSFALTYSATLAPSAQLGGDGIDVASGLDNTASVDSYESLPEDGRDYEGPEVTETVTPQFPFVTIEKDWVDTDIAQIGVPSTFQITLTNEGGATAYNLEVIDTLPANWEFTYADNAPDSVSSANPSVLTWTGLAAAGLAPGGEITLTYTATPLADAVDDPGTDDEAHTNTASVTAEDATGSTGNGDGPYNGPPAEADVFIHEVDLDIDKNVTGAAIAGDPNNGVTWTIDVTNDGPNPEEGPVTVVDTLPEHFTYVDYDSASSDWTCDTPGTDRVLTCVYAGGIAANGSAPTLSINGWIPADAPTGEPLVNTATVEGVTYESELNKDNNTDDAQTPITPIADLGIVKQLTSSDLVAGATANYRITVTNHGPSTARGPITVYDTLPNYLSFESFVGLDEAAWDCDDVTGQEIVCDTGDLLSGASRTFDFQVTLAASHDATVINTATVEGTTPEGPHGPDDEGEEPNQSTSGMTPTRSADLAITKNLDPDVAYVAGTEVPFVITVINHGPSTAQEVEISDELASYLTYVDADSDDGWTCEASGQSVTCELAGEHLVGPEHQTSLVLNVLIDENHTGDIDNAAVVSSITPDPVPTNNEDDTTTRTAGLEADLGIVKTLVTDPIIAGAPVTYDLVVTNHGPSASGTPVTVTDVVPAGFSFTSSSSNATCEPGEVDGVDVVECVLSAALATGTANAQTVTLTFDTDSDLAGTNAVNTATVDGPYDDPTPENNTSTTTNPITELTNLTIDKSVVGDAEVASGSEVTWEITVENEGPSDAQNVVVRDVLPDGLTLLDVTGAGWDCGDPAAFPCSFGTLVAGESTTLTVSTLLSSAEPANSTLENIATVETSTPETTEEDNTSSDEITTYTLADLGITKTHSGEAVAGESVAYTITVHNYGPSDAQGPITVTDTLPEGLTFASAAAPWTCAPGDTNAQEVTCVLLPETDGIVAGTDAPALVMQVDIAAGTADETLVNQVVVESPTDDPNPDNDEDTDEITPVGSADLSVVKTHAPEDVRVGDEFDFTVVVTNDGPSEARGVTLAELLPEGLTLVEISGTDWTCEDADCSYGPALAPGASAPELTVTVSVEPAAYPQVTNIVTVDSETPDPDPSNNEDEDPVDVPAQVNLAVIKTSDAQFKVGSEGRYGFTVSNTGPTSDPGPITLTDVLPEGIAFVEGGGDTADCVADGQTVTCVLADGLGVDEQIEVELLVAVGATAAPSVTNTVTVSTPSEDTDPEDDTSTVTTPVEPTAVLSIEKTLADVDGDAATWQITVTNDGPSATDEPIVFVDNLPNYLTYTGHGGTGWLCEVDGQVVTCTYEASLAAGESTSVEINTAILVTDGSEITNTVTLVSGGDIPTDSTTSSATVTAPDDSDDWLSRTGFDNPAVALAALVLLLAGGALLVVYIRRRKA